MFLETVAVASVVLTPYLSLGLFILLFDGCLPLLLCMECHETDVSGNQKIVAEVAKQMRKRRIEDSSLLYSQIRKEREGEFTSKSKKEKDQI